MLALISCQNWLYFSQSFPCMIVGFDVRVECENLVKICEEPWSSWLARDWLASGLPTKGHVRSTCWKLKESSAKRHLVTHLATRPTREMYCQLVLVCFTLVFSLITRLSVILCLHLSFLTLCALHLLFIVYVYVLECSSGFLRFIYSYSTLS